jgi:hypothetical protein
MYSYNKKMGDKAHAISKGIGLIPAEAASGTH